jgi:hypothetical protein
VRVPLGGPLPVEPHVLLHEALHVPRLGVLHEAQPRVAPPHVEQPLPPLPWVGLAARSRQPVESAQRLRSRPPRQTVV